MRKKLRIYLEALLDEKGVSLKKFCDNQGLPHSTVYQVMVTKRNAPRSETWRQLAEAIRAEFGVEVSPHELYVLNSPFLTEDDKAAQ